MFSLVGDAAFCVLIGREFIWGVGWAKFGRILYLKIALPGEGRQIWEDSESKNSSGVAKIKLSVRHVVVKHECKTDILRRLIATP